MLKTLRTLAASLLLASPALAQDCSQLDVTVVDGVDTQTVTFDVTGSAPLSFHFIVVGDTPGSVSFPVAGTVLELGLQPPFLAFPLGMSDFTGAVSTSFDVPALIDGNFFSQAIGLEFLPPSIGFCTSNVAPFTL